MVGWWVWLWWFAGQSRDLTHWYSWVSVQLKRDGFSITFGILTFLSAMVLAWAWHSTIEVWKRTVVCCGIMVGGIILPVLAGAYSLIANIGYPEGWHWDMARAGLVTVTPILCLLSGLGVLWLHRSRPMFLVCWLGFAYLGGWLVVPLLLSGNLKKGFHHFTHLRFENVGMTLLAEDGYSNAP